jgi:trehalose 6-phosphate synthase/phosphatase
VTYKKWQLQCSCCNWQGTPEGVEDNGSLTRVAAFPIGIDPERFAAALEDDAVRGSIAQLLNKYAGRKVSSLLTGCTL